MNHGSGIDHVDARHAAALYSSIIAVSADAIVSIDEEQRIILFNHGAEAVFGYAAADVLGKPLDILIPEEVRDLHREQVREFARSGISACRMSRRKVVGRRADGEAFPADASISQVEVAGEKFYTASLRDITTEVRAEELLRFISDAGQVLSESIECDEVLGRIMEIVVPRMADYCVLDLVDEEGRVSRPVAAHLDPAQQVLVERLRDFPATGKVAGAARVLRTGEAEVVPEVDADWLRAVARNEAHYQLLLQLAPSSALIVPLRARARIIGALTCAYVLPERRYEPELLPGAERLAARAALAIDNAKLYRGLRSAVRTRDEVLRIVAHDLRDPLNTITLTVGVLVETMAPELARHLSRHLEVIRRSTQRANRLIGDLLDAARISEGRLAVELRPVATGPLLDEVIALQRNRAEERQLRLECHASAALPAIMADRDRILQVFTNLIGNALKFTPAGGRITMRAMAQGDEVHFSISDTGPGIPANALSRIFDAFWQVHAEGGAGAGLGLAISKGIVAAHGGRLWAESEPGAGATFYFTVPVAESEPE